MSNKYLQNDAPVMKYNPQLDGLRFCAVLFVVCYHWLPSIAEQKVSYFFGAAINFFFVLSSYLITNILFSARHKCEKANIPKTKGMLVFLLRRTVRIFPAYYFFLFVLLLLPAAGSEMKQHAGMYFSYLANYQIFQEQNWPTVTSHIWTLAVEEQFYLVWPLVIMFIPHQHLLKTFVSIIATSIAIKAMVYQAQPVVPQSILTQYCVDAFAVGGLLTYKYTLPEEKRKPISKYVNIIFFSGLPFGILTIFYQSYYFTFVLNGLLFSLGSMKIIEGAILGYKGGFGKFLQNKIVLYLGRISYGIYLFHLLVPIVFWQLYTSVYTYLSIHYPAVFNNHIKQILFVQDLMASEAGCFIIYTILVVSVATFSWYVIERPLSRLKLLMNIGATKTIATAPAPHFTQRATQ